MTTDGAAKMYTKLFISYILSSTFFLIISIYFLQPLSFTQQLQQCTRGGKTRPLSKLLSPLQSEPQSPIYASPPLSPVHDITPNIFGNKTNNNNLLEPANLMLLLLCSGAMNIYQPVLRHNNFAKAPDTHFARDTHMRIILGNSSGGKGDKKSGGQETNANSR